MMFQTGDIVFFPEYDFTDGGETKAHYALIMIPRYWKWINQTYCVVITSNPRSQNSYTLKCSNNKYSCFSRMSYACFDRLDLERYDEIKDIKKAELDFQDIKKGLNLLYCCFQKEVSCYNETFLRAALIREWKKRRDQLRTI